MASQRLHLLQEGSCQGSLSLEGRSESKEIRGWLRRDESGRKRGLDPKEQGEKSHRRARTWLCHQAGEALSIQWCSEHQCPNLLVPGVAVCP